MNTAPLSKIDHEPIHDKIYVKMKALLMEAYFDPGSQLSLRELASAFGVSVAPVRAALLRLLAEKAVVQSSATNSNFYVPVLNQAEFEEIMQLRVLLEGRAAKMACDNMTPVDIDQLSALADQLHLAAEENRTEDYLRLNREFKFVVFEAAGSPVMLDLISSLWVRIGPLMHFYGRLMKHHKDLDQYQDAVIAFQKRDAAKAEQILQQDVFDGADFLREVAFSGESA